MRSWAKKFATSTQPYERSFRAPEKTRNKVTTECSLSKLADDIDKNGNSSSYDWIGTVGERERLGKSFLDCNFIAARGFPSKNRSRLFMQVVAGNQNGKIIIFMAV